MKASVILRKAAWRIVSGHCVGGCVAIKDDECLYYGYKPSKDVQRAYDYFKSSFKPKRVKDHGFWFSPQKYDEQRILALLITADMAESVGD